MSLRMVSETTAPSTHDALPPPRRESTKPEPEAPCATGIPDKTRCRNRSAKLQLVKPDTYALNVRSESDTQTDNDWKSELETKTDQLMAELQKVITKCSFTCF